MNTKNAKFNNIIIASVPRLHFSFSNDTDAINLNKLYSPFRRAGNGTGEQL